MTVTESRTDEQRVGDLIDELLRGHPPADTKPSEFLGAQFDRGLAWVHFPEGHGGLGLSPKLQTVINERVFAAGGPNPYYRNPIGYGMCGPTVVEWGSEEQKQRYLRPLFTGEEVWCQLFSEPGSGSDFAGLSSRGVRPGHGPAELSCRSRSRPAFRRHTPSVACRDDRDREPDRRTARR